MPSGRPRSHLPPRCSGRDGNPRPTQKRPPNTTWSGFGARPHPDTWKTQTHPRGGFYPQREGLGAKRCNAVRSSRLDINNAGSEGQKCPVVSRPRPRHVLGALVAEERGGPHWGARRAPSEQSRARGCSPDYGKMSVHHTRPMASRTFEGEGSGQPGDAFWEELIMSQHLCPSTKMYKYLQHTRRLL